MSILGWLLVIAVLGGAWFFSWRGSDSEYQSLQEWVDDRGRDE